MPSGESTRASSPASTRLDFATGQTFFNSRLTASSLDLSRAYTSVIVDEVQDLTCVGLKLAHTLVGDSPDGLFLLSGMANNRSTRAASPSMRAEYRLLDAPPSSPVITATAQRSCERHWTLCAGDQFDDLDSDPEPGSRAVDVDREGGQVKRCDATSPASQRAALISDLEWTISTDTRVGDVALLVRSNAEAVAWSKHLGHAGIPCLLLADYDGRSIDAVKIGTYQRAKGLEFSCVFLPDHDRAVAAQRDRETDDAYRERAELQRRQLFVAMTRARDRLWLGRTS